MPVLRIAVLLLGIFVLWVAIFAPDLTFSQRFNMCVAAVIDFGACAFTYLYPKLMRKRDK